MSLRDPLPHEWDFDKLLGRGVMFGLIAASIGTLVIFGAVVWAIAYAVCNLISLL